MAFSMKGSFLSFLFVVFFVCFSFPIVAFGATGMIQPGTPDGVPDSIDCAVRELAYDYGRQMMPQRGSFKTLFDALQLNACNHSVPHVEDIYIPPNFGAAINSGQSLFVDAVNGADSNDGTISKPLKSIMAAVKLLRAHKMGGGEKVINLRKGTFYLKDQVLLGSEDSGLKIQNYNGEEVFVSGGIPFNVRKSDWQVYKQGKSWDQTQGQNNVFGQAQSRQDTETIKYIGNYTSFEDCSKAATGDKRGPFVSLTFHEPNFGGDFAGQCFARTDEYWAPTAEENVVSALFVQHNVWKANLDSKLDFGGSIPGLRINGGRGIRAKYPNGDPEQSGHFLTGADAAMGGGDYIWGWTPLSANTVWVKPKRKPDAEEVVVTGADWPSVEWPMTEAGGSSWTGEGDWGEFHAGYGGYCDDLSPPFGYWCAMNPPRGQCWDKDTNTGSGCTQTHMSPDGMVLERASRYSNATDAVVQSWRGGGRWFTQQWRVTEFIKENNTLIFDPMTGSQGGEGMTNAGQWWIENVKEEVDSPMEWFYDSLEHALYFQPNASSPSGTENFVATHTRVLFNLTGSMENPVKDVTIQGITLRDSRHTYLDIHGMPSGGDWALERSGAIFMEGVERVSIASNQFTRIDGNGVSINGYARNVSVENNDFNWIGSSCMTAWGHTSNCLNENCSKSLPAKVGPDGRNGEQPRFTRVTGNIAREIGIWQKQSSMWFQAVTAQTTFENNIHFNGPRAGLNFNDGFGGGDFIARNLILNCVRESGDHGPWNSWDRLPYITNIRTGKPSVIPEYREITKNFIISVYSSQEAIDTDDGSSYYNTHDNFFIYAANGLKSDFGGQYNKHINNTYVFVGDCWGSGNSDQFVNNTCIANSDVGGFGSDCNKGPLMTVSGNKIYNQNGNLGNTKICDKSNVVAGKWPSAQSVVQMGKDILFK